MRRSQSAVMKEKREHEVERRTVRSRQKCPDFKGECGEQREFLVKIFSTSFFITMSSESTFGDNSDEFSIFRFFLSLADRDLAECQITQTLTLS